MDNISTSTCVDDTIKAQLGRNGVTGTRVYLKTSLIQGATEVCTLKICRARSLESLKNSFEEKFMLYALEVYK